MKNSLIIFLISTASGKIIRKVSKANTLRMRSYNTMPRNNSDNSAEPARLEFKQSRRVPPMQPWPDFSPTYHLQGKRLHGQL